MLCVLALNFLLFGVPHPGWSMTPIYGPDLPSVPPLIADINNNHRAVIDGTAFPLDGGHLTCCRHAFHGYEQCSLPGCGLICLSVE